MTGQWFSPGPSVSSTNKTDRHDIIEILLKVALNTIKQTTKHIYICDATSEKGPYGWRHHYAENDVSKK